MHFSDGNNLKLFFNSDGKEFTYFQSKKQTSMEIAIITGSAGLIGSEAVDFFAGKFDKIIGIDNDFRQYFFGIEASTEWNRDRLS